MPKEQKAVAYDNQSNASELPPDFNISTNGKNSNKPIQAMFANTQMGLDEKFPNIKLPGSPAPFVPTPYPNVQNKSMGMMGGKGMMGGMGMMGTGTKKKDSSFLSKIGSSISSGIGGIAKGVGGLAKGVGGLLKGGVKKFGGASKSLTGSVSDFMNAVKFGKNMFKLQSGFKNITIMSVSAIGSPGCLDGPRLESFIKTAPSVAGMTGEDKKMRNAVAKGVSSNFEKWKSQVTVPGLPWYPAFVAYPGPMAPPMPNVPTPLISCVSSGLSHIISSSKIKDSIYNELPSEMKTLANEAFIQALASQIAMHFLTWLAKQQVMMVLGKGPVPSFAPPVVPSGPVVGGDIIPSKNHLMS